MKTWSVEIGPDYHDDTYLGTYDECMAYAQNILKDYPDAEIQLAEIEDDNGMCTYTYDVEKVVKKMFRVREQYANDWSNDVDWLKNPVVDLVEIERCARGWDRTVESLMEQVDEI